MIVSLFPELTQKRETLVTKNFVLLIRASRIGFMRPRPEVNKQAARHPRDALVQVLITPLALLGAR